LEKNWHVIRRREPINAPTVGASVQFSVPISTRACAFAPGTLQRSAVAKPIVARKNLFMTNASRLGVKDIA
jgi:hypothetical protein